MAEEGKEREDLIHELRNVQAEKQALKHLLGRATDRIEDLVQSDCEDAHKAQALKDAERFRRAAS